MRRLATTAALVACAMAAPTNAQDGSETAASRTPANAQRFLQAMPPRSVWIGKAIFKSTATITSDDACMTRLGLVSATVNEARSWRRWQNGGVLTEQIDSISGWTGSNLVRGDVIVSIAGKPVASTEDVVRLMSASQLYGDTAQAVIRRRGAEFTTWLRPDMVSQEIEIAIPDEIKSRLVINWSNVQQVAPGGLAIIVQTADSRGPYMVQLVYDTTSTRDRVLAATQYLQQACDKTKDLGF